MVQEGKDNYKLFLIIFQLRYGPWLIFVSISYLENK